MRKLALLLAAASGLAWAPLATVVRLDNARVLVTEVAHPPGGVRERSVRARDQLIVFLDACRYERTDPLTGEKTLRERRAGETIWHSKGEDAPRLRNVGDRPYRTLVIELKP
jgi:hypothetical protein